GDRQRATITGAADQPLMVEVPNISTLKAGDRVGLHVNSASLRLLPD
ncbi:MAG: TOBE domain-containing protein, partial [Bosea sp. (in: a-proteobacteria)]